MNCLWARQERFSAVLGVTATLSIRTLAEEVNCHPHVQFFLCFYVLFCFPLPCDVLLSVSSAVHLVFNGIHAVLPHCMHSRHHHTGAQRMLETIGRSDRRIKKKHTKLKYIMLHNRMHVTGIATTHTHTQRMYACSAWQSLRGRLTTYSALKLIWCLAIILLRGERFFFVFILCFSILLSLHDCWPCANWWPEPGISHRVRTKMPFWIPWWALNKRGRGHPRITVHRIHWTRETRLMPPASANN